MECIENEGTTIQKFYSGTNIFITGGTGFMGKAVLEKLLRSCPEIKNIYLLIRNKKGKDVDSRLEEIFYDPIFGPLKEKFPKFQQKVLALSGDCSVPGFGLKPSDRLLLVHNVNIVFHGAATVRFDEKMRQAISINIMGSKSMLDLAHEMKNLKAIIHISTVYSNCNLRTIEEKFYDHSVSHKKLCAMIDCVNDKVLDKITPHLIDEWPNTYAFTKAMAEDLIRDEGIGLPIGLFRPAIVISSRNEPIPGWTDNVYGPTGFFVGTGLGLIRTLHCDVNTFANIVPVDMTINALITAAWDIGTRPRCQNSDDIPIFNYVVPIQKLITWGEYTEKCLRYGLQVATARAIWCCSLTINKYHFLHMLYAFFLHFLPAFIIDGIAIVLGKEPKLTKIYKKIHKFSEVLSYFSTRTWTFTDYNVQLLWKKMQNGDKELFDFNMDGLDWENYFHDYTRGIRVYLLKDDPSTIPQGRQKYIRGWHATDLERAKPIIVATAVLHNQLQGKNNLPPQDDPNLQLPFPWTRLLCEGQIAPLELPGSWHNNEIRMTLINT